MKKSYYKYFIVTVLALVIFYLGSSYLDHINRLLQSEYRISPIGFIITQLMPVTFGFLITFPLKYPINRHSFDWPKFLIQGIPALFLSIQFSTFISVIMQVLNITEVDLGIINYLILYQTKNMIIHTMAGVWFGKVLAECFSVQSVNEGINQ